jgi:hypothetical protein
MKNPKAPAPVREVKWELAPGFRACWKKYGKGNAEIKAEMAEFDRCKRSIPPMQLPGRMSDHKLDGSLMGFYDCLDSGAKRNALKRSGFEHPFQARQVRLGMAS